MGLLQKAVETYDAMAQRVGVTYGEEKEPLAPISHILTRAQIEITLDQNGSFITARSLDKDETKIIIPVTEESAGRTSAPCAHPLCDQLGYLAPYDERKHALYLNALTDWEQSAFTHPKLSAILHYIQGETILPDLANDGIIQLNQDGRPEDEKMLVRWVVLGQDETQYSECWRDKSLMQSFVDYTSAKRAGEGSALCMVSGSLESPAGQHPKGIIALNGNAKLISSNDSSGFTYRGRFDAPVQAATVGYTASQKAHCALRWLAANQGVSFGGRTFLCWNPQGIKVPPIHGPMGRGRAQRAANPTQYRQMLQETLSGWKNELPAKEGVVITAFDAATTGRLAVTYYNELMASDFLDRLHNWDASCCWENGSYGIQSPTLFQIVNLAFGTPRSGKAETKVETDERILRQQMQRLIACRIDQAPFPADIERNLVERASNLILYEGESRKKLLFTACAAIRKYYNDHKKEELDMALNPNCTDRSYLFGRLLAIADVVERSTYDKDTARETNALRVQKAFALRPMATWKMLEERLAPYYKQLNFGLEQYYRNMTQEILEKIMIPDTSEETKRKQSELNRRLEDLYLIGFYHQRAYCYKKKTPAEEE